MLHEQIKRAQAKGLAITSIIRLHSHLATKKNPYEVLNNEQAQATQATKTQNRVNSTSVQYDNPEARRAISFAKYCERYELLFTRDDVQKWEHELSRAAGNKELEAFTKLHSYLDEFIPF